MANAGTCVPAFTKQTNGATLHSSPLWVHSNVNPFGDTKDNRGLALGHLLGGEVIVDETVQGKSPHEQQANAFAAGLLMPAEGVRGAVRRLRTRLGDPPNPLDWIVWLVASFGVSEQAAAYRLTNLRLIKAVGGTTAEAVQKMAENPDMTREAWARLGLSP